MKSSVYMMLLAFVYLLPLQLSARQETERHDKLEAADVQHEQSLFHVQTEWTDHNNETLVLGDFAGEPVIVVMFYGQCTGTCPVLMQRTWNLYNELNEQAKERIQVIAVSFDYKNDTPQALKTYAEMEQLDIPGWHFVTANHTSIRELAMLLGVRYRERSDGHFEHSNLITVLDGEGKITARVSGLQQPLDTAATHIEELAGGEIQ